MKTVQEVIDNPTYPIIEGLISPNLLSGDEVMLAVADPQENDGDPLLSDYHIIGMISTQQWTAGRGVTTVGEIGSKALYTLLTDGDERLAVNRLILFKDLLKSIYDVLEYDGELTNTQIFLDLDSDLFDRPVNLMLIFFENNADNNYLTGRSIAQLLRLKNAIPERASMGFKAGQRGVMQSATFVWEKTEPLPVGTP